MFEIILVNLKNPVEYLNFFKLLITSAGYILDIYGTGATFNDKRGK